MASQRRTLNPIQPIYPRVKLENGEELIGTTPAGNMIVRRTVTKPKKVPVLNTDGTQRYRTNAVGQPVTPMFKLERGTRVEEYEKLPCRNGTVLRNYDYKPDPEEAARQERARKIKEFGDKLAEAAVDKGLDVDALLGAVAGETDEEVGDGGFPQHIAFGRFRLSDGSEVKGKAAAIEAQAALDSALQAA